MAARDRSHRDNALLALVRAGWGAAESVQKRTQKRGSAFLLMHEWVVEAVVK